MNRIFRANGSTHRRITRPAPRDIGVVGDSLADSWVTVNGIFGSSRGWEEQAANWGNAHTADLWTGFYYWTGLLRSFQEDHADALAAELRTARHGGRLSVIGHSNAGSLIPLALQRHPDVKVDDCFLLAAANYEDCGRGWLTNGLNALLASGQIGRVILGVSKSDGVLGSQWLTPSWWGMDLGRAGPKNASPAAAVTSFDRLGGAPRGARFIVGHRDDYGHLAWVNSGSSFNLTTIQSILSLGAP